MIGVRIATFYLTAVFFSMLVLGLYILGTARYLTNFEENTCEMTYMFEYPQYVRIAHKPNIEERYPRFGLYVYGEGFVTEKHRRMKFSGIPVLFVPGNAGSHEQVRSLASVSLRKSINDRTSFHFDYFTVSLGKDYSALYGGVLEEQTTYVSLCISKILGLYAGNVDKIILIGHSMGGIVAKAALLQNRSGNGNETVVNILLTLASPHKPIFLPDRTIARYYSKLDSSKRCFVNTSFVSIAGGPRDILVSSSQTIEPTADLNIVTSGVPNVWKSTDHLCILWCKQLILTIVRALFDCVDANARPPKITSDSGLIKRALSYHLTSRIAGKRLQPYEDKIKFENGAEWIERIERHYTWTGNDVAGNRTVFLMIRLDGGTRSYDSIGIESINLEARDWLFACSAHTIQSNSRVCEWGWNLTNRTNLLLDPTNHPRKSIDLESEEFRDWKVSHIVVRIPVNELRKNRKTTAVRIHVDLYKRHDRTIRLDADGLADKFFRPIRLLSPNPYAVAGSSRGEIRYYASLVGIEDAVAVEIEPLKDDAGRIGGGSLRTPETLPQATIELLEDSHDHERTMRTSQVRSFVSSNDKPNGEFSRKRLVMYLARKKNAMLRMNLWPEYSYRMTIRRAGIVDRMACLVRDRWPSVYSIVVSLCLLGIAFRLDDSPTTTALVALMIIVAATSLDIIPETLVALGLVNAIAITAFVLVIFSGSIVRNITARFLARIVAMPSLWFDWLLSGFERLPILTTLILISLISATCGAVAMLLSVPLYFLKLTRVYDEFLEELLMASLRQFLPTSFGRKREKRKRAEANDDSTGTDLAVTAVPSSESQPTVSPREKNFRETIFDHLLLFVTWMFTAIPAIPSALVWAKNFRHETRLTTEDPAFLISWIVLTLWGSLGLVEIPNCAPHHSAKRRKLCGIILQVGASIIVFAATLENSASYQWIIPPMVALAVSCLAILSLFPGEGPINDNPAIAQ